MGMSTWQSGGVGRSAAWRDVATTQRADQIRAERQPPCRDLGAQRLRQQQLVLAREHRNVVVQAGPVALDRDVVCVLSGHGRLLLLDSLLLERRPVGYD